MEKIRRQRRSASTWGEIVARQRQSGLSVQSFCEQEGIMAASFYVWRSRLHRQTPASESEEPSSRAQKPSTEFIDLGAIDSSRSRFEVRLDLGGGVLLHLVRG